MTTPASAATAPESTNSGSLMRLTRRPEKNAASSLAPIAKTERPNGVKCRSTAKSDGEDGEQHDHVRAPRCRRSSRTRGRSRPLGKSVTESSPMTTNARPRNRASVPIVTASDGRPSARDEQAVERAAQAAERRCRSG